MEENKKEFLQQIKNDIQHEINVDMTRQLLLLSKNLIQYNSNCKTEDAIRFAIEYALDSIAETSFYTGISAVAASVALASGIKESILEGRTFPNEICTEKNLKEYFSYGLLTLGVYILSHGEKDAADKRLNDCYNEICNHIIKARALLHDEPHLEIFYYNAILFLYEYKKKIVFS